MAIKTINDTHLTNIANAIRNKNGETSGYTPADMPAAIGRISGGSSGGSNITFVYVPPTTSPNFNGYVLDLTPYGITLDSQVKFVQCSGGTITYEQNLGIYTITSNKLQVNENYIFQIGTYQSKRGLICYYKSLDGLNPISVWKNGFILGYEGGN